MKKRILFIGDCHCGSLHGLTPPDWQAPPARAKIRAAQAELWDWFESRLAEVKAERPIDIAVFNGDMVDGDGKKSQGVEELTTDQQDQVAIAEMIVNKIGAKANHFVTGTGYHVGDGTNFENLLARRFGCESANKLFLSVNGLVFDIRHHTSRTSIPYGMNAAAKDKMWNTLLAERGREPQARVTIRSHVHWYRFSGECDWLAMTLPCLEYPNTKYGARCSGDYTMGFVIFDIEDDGSYTWKPILAQPAAAQAEVLIG